jgi:hypothetical protein
MFFSSIFGLSLSDCFVCCEEGGGGEEGGEEGEEHRCHVEDIFLPSVSENCRKTIDINFP